MAHLKNKPWHAPELKRFETPEELLAYYQANATPEELEKLHELFEQMRRAQQMHDAQIQLRKKAAG